MRSLAIQLGVMILPLAAAMAQAPVPAFATVAKGDASGQQTAVQAVVRTAAEWKALWKEHSAAEKMPEVDFSKQMVVGVFLGTKPSAGHEVEIVAVRHADKELVVEYVQRQPGPGTMAAQILTEPFHLVSTARFEGPVRFQLRKP